MFARIINFITFRIACPALRTKYIDVSHWQLGNATLSNAQAMKYDANVQLKCNEGYWLQNTSTHGNANTTQNVKCGLNRDWTPAKNCALISMNLFENCLTSLCGLQIPKKHSKDVSGFLM
ncbi:hypothetical protein DPMN_050546 [Dreissena polymorpha]|uniref:Sushi domain-containing protein n=1 Tax=Dreissena polymorpha TaxID=45954 RepID=A0A9D4HPE2_DREPO|nr:hypothetical protein DPMN_050546 [Dreissena polymorpha]